MLRPNRNFPNVNAASLLELQIFDAQKFWRISYYVREDQNEKQNRFRNFERNRFEFSGKFLKIRN